MTASPATQQKAVRTELSSSNVEHERQERDSTETHEELGDGDSLGASVDSESHSSHFLQTDREAPVGESAGRYWLAALIPTLLPLLLISATHKTSVVRPWWLGWIELALALPSVSYFLVVELPKQRHKARLLPLLTLMTVCLVHGVAMMLYLTLRPEARVGILHGTTSLLCVGAIWIQQLSRHRLRKQPPMAADVPPSMRVLNATGECSKPTSAIRSGDIVAVPPRSTFAFSGWVVSGASELLARPHASSRGEAVPPSELMQLGPGDRVDAGALNGAGELWLEVTAVDDPRDELKQSSDADAWVNKVNQITFATAAVVFVWWALRTDAATALLPSLALLAVPWSALVASVRQQQQTLRARRGATLVCNESLLVETEARVAGIKTLQAHTTEKVLAVAAGALHRHPSAVAHAIRLHAARQDIVPYAKQSLALPYHRALQRWPQLKQIVAPNPDMETVVVGNEQEVLGWIEIALSAASGSLSVVGALRRCQQRLMLLSSLSASSTERFATALGLPHTVVVHSEVDASDEANLLAEWRTHSPLVRCVRTLPELDVLMQQQVALSSQQQKNQARYLALGLGALIVAAGALFSAGVVMTWGVVLVGTALAVVNRNEAR